MKKPKIFSRTLKIRKIRSHLEHNSFPRLQMLLLVSLTGGIGFLASVLLLSAGLAEIWLRYIASLGVAYGAFLILLWLWLKTDSSDYIDIIDVPCNSTSADNSCSDFDGGGGSFGGGGASNSFGDASDSPDVEAVGDVLGEGLSFVPDADEFAIPIFLVVIVIAMLFSSLFIVYSAPVLFAELLVDAALSASLYHRLHGLETQHWLKTAIRRTIMPFAMTAAVVSLCGYGMSVYFPEANSMGDIIHLMNVRN